MKYLEIFTNIIFILSLGWYLITNLQWYNYKLQRVILKHHKQRWHISYFVAPVLLFYIVDDFYFNIYVPFYLIAIYLWHKSLDKSLVLTSRVKRFFVILFFVTTIIDGLCFLSSGCHFGVFVPLFLSWAISTILEKIFFISFKHQAKQKLKNFNDLTIIVITASFGKTSIKNYLYQSSIL